MAKKFSLGISKRHREATVDLARLNREMAIQMMVLAGETGDIEPLIGAVKAMRRTTEIYNPENTPIENAQIQKKLGDVLFRTGRAEDNQRAYEYAILAYRGAITLASLLGADKLRSEARQNYQSALIASGMEAKKPSLSLMGAA